MGDIINNPNINESENNNEVYNKSVIVIDKNSGWWIPKHLRFAPAIFDTGIELFSNTFTKASYLLSCVYMLYEKEDAKDIMETVCKDIKEAITESDKDIDQFEVSFIEPIEDEYIDKDGKKHDTFLDCFVAYDMFNEPFMDYISNPDNKDAFYMMLCFLFGDAVLFNNTFVQMSNQEIIDSVFDDYNEDEVDFVTF